MSMFSHIAERSALDFKAVPALSVCFDNVYDNLNAATFGHRVLCRQRPCNPLSTHFCDPEAMLVDIDAVRKSSANLVVEIFSAASSARRVSVTNAAGELQFHTAADDQKAKIGRMLSVLARAAKESDFEEQLVPKLPGEVKQCPREPALLEGVKAVPVIRQVTCLTSVCVPTMTVLEGTFSESVILSASSPSVMESASSTSVNSLTSHTRNPAWAHKQEAGGSESKQKKRPRPIDENESLHAHGERLLDVCFEQHATTGGQREKSPTVSATFHGRPLRKARSPVRKIPHYQYAGWKLADPRSKKFPCNPFSHTPVDLHRVFFDLDTAASSSADTVRNKVAVPRDTRPAKNADQDAAKSQKPQPHVGDGAKLGTAAPLEQSNSKLSYDHKETGTVLRQPGVLPTDHNVENTILPFSAIQKGNAEESSTVLKKTSGKQMEEQTAESRTGSSYLLNKNNTKELAVMAGFSSATKATEKTDSGKTATAKDVDTNLPSRGDIYLQQPESRLTTTKFTAPGATGSSSVGEGPEKTDSGKTLTAVDNEVDAVFPMPSDGSSCHIQMAIEHALSLLRDEFEPQADDLLDQDMSAESVNVEFTVSDDSRPDSVALRLMSSGDASGVPSELDEADLLIEDLDLETASITMESSRNNKIDSTADYGIETLSYSASSVPTETVIGRAEETNDLACSEASNYLVDLLIDAVEVEVSSNEAISRDVYTKIAEPDVMPEAESQAKQAAAEAAATAVTESAHSECLLAPEQEPGQVCDPSKPEVTSPSIFVEVKSGIMRSVERTTELLPGDRGNEAFMPRVLLTAYGREVSGATDVEPENSSETLDITSAPSEENSQEAIQVEKHGTSRKPMEGSALSWEEYNKMLVQSAQRVATGDDRKLKSPSPATPEWHAGIPKEDTNSSPEEGEIDEASHLDNVSRDTRAGDRFERSRGPAGYEKLFRSTSRQASKGYAELTELSNKLSSVLHFAAEGTEAAGIESLLRSATRRFDKMKIKFKNLLKVNSEACSSVALVASVSDRAESDSVALERMGMKRKRSGNSSDHSNANSRGSRKQMWDEKSYNAYLDEAEYSSSVHSVVSVVSISSTDTPEKPRKSRHHEKHHSSHGHHSGRRY